nr:amidase family protein [Nocardia sp. CNY236]
MNPDAQAIADGFDAERRQGRVRGPLVGIKPIVGLLSRSGVIGVAAPQDTTGPMGRCVADVTTMLTVLGAVPTESTRRCTNTGWTRSSHRPKGHRRTSSTRWSGTTSCRVGVPQPLR